MTTNLVQDQHGLHKKGGGVLEREVQRLKMVTALPEEDLT